MLANRIGTFYRVITRTGIAVSPSVAKQQVLKRTLIRSFGSVLTGATFAITPAGGVGFITYRRLIRFDASKVYNGVIYFQAQLYTSDPNIPSHYTQCVLQRNTALDGSGTWVDIATLIGTTNTSTIYRSSNIYGSLPQLETLYRVRLGGNAAGALVSYYCDGASLVAVI
jgi:hypothetical protein